MALTSRLTSWLRIGVEGEVPADFEDKAQIFSGRFLARVPLIDREDKLFLQGSFSFSYFDGTPIVSDPNYVPEYGAATFVNGEVLIGYTRKISPSWSLGGMLGGQYSTMNQYVFNSSTNSVYNRASFIGSYIF